jgi:hypothetical protein
MPMAVTWRVYSPGGHPRNGKEAFGVGEGTFIRGQEANDGAYDGVALLVQDGAANRHLRPERPENRPRQKDTLSPALACQGT